MDTQDRRKLMRETFDTVSPGYDNHALRFFVESARCVAGLLEVVEDGRVLDVATGTGNVAMEIARRFPRAKVTGVDFSQACSPRRGPRQKPRGSTTWNSSKWICMS